MTRSALVIEDDPSIGALVHTYLTRDGFDVAWARAGEEGLVEIERREPAIVVLDVGLPDIDGFEVCRRLRRTSRVPVLFLTARDEEVDRIVGLELGGDDYVTKPFSPRELVARVHAILRRVEEPEPAPLLEAGDVVVDRRARRVTVAGGDIALRTLEFDLLVALLERNGDVVGRDELLEHVWGLAFPGGTRTVDVHVANVRRKLGRPDLIATVRGSGYRAVVPAGA